MKLLRDEIRSILNPSTILPFPVTSKEDPPWATIRIQHALIRIAERIDKIEALLNQDGE